MEDASHFQSEQGGGQEEDMGPWSATTPVESPEHLLAAHTLADYSQRASNFTMITLAFKEMNH